MNQIPELIFSDQPVAYPDAVAFMENRVADIVAEKAPECLWFLEHPPLYTAGTSANPADLLHHDRFPVYDTKRGGEYTYHGRDRYTLRRVWCHRRENDHGAVNPPDWRLFLRCKAADVPKTTNIPAPFPQQYRRHGFP